MSIMKLWLNEGILARYRYRSESDVEMQTI